MSDIAHIVSTDTQWLIQDPLHPTTEVQTEQGVKKFEDGADILVVDHPDIAAQIKEEHPHFLVSPFENAAYRSPVARTRKMFVMPELPWRKEK